MEHVALTLISIAMIKEHMIVPTIDLFRRVALVIVIIVIILVVELIAALSGAVSLRLVLVRVILRPLIPALRVSYVLLVFLGCGSACYSPAQYSCVNNQLQEKAQNNPSPPSTPFNIALIPPSLRVNDPSATFFANFTGVGVQVYNCTSNGSYTLLYPDADLYNGTEIVGHHFAGPSWVYYVDGSIIKGAANVTFADPINPEQNIPWLLVNRVSTTGIGKFVSVKYVERLETYGGQIEGPCTVGQVYESRYHANYLFYTAA